MLPTFSVDGELWIYNWWFLLACKASKLFRRKIGTEHFRLALWTIIVILVPWNKIAEMISAHQCVFTFWFQSTRSIEHVERKTLKSHFWLYKRIIWKNSIVSGNRKKWPEFTPKRMPNVFFFHSASEHVLGFPHLQESGGEKVGRNCLPHQSNRASCLVWMGGGPTVESAEIRRLPVEVLVFFPLQYLYLFIFFRPGLQGVAADCWWLKSQGQPPSLGCMNLWNPIKR